MPRHLRRGRDKQKDACETGAAAGGEPSGVPVRLLLSGCAGVVLTVSETCPVPVIEFGSTKHADSVRLEACVQVSLIRRGVISWLH